MATARGFYLAGGTALALHIGHRESVDFDWFGSDPIPDPHAFSLEVGAVARATLEPTQPLQPGTVVGLLGKVKVSFFRYEYPLLGPTVDYASSALASLRDLVAMKLAAIYDRGSKRDFIDVHALLDQFTFPEMIDLFTAKFPKGSVPHLLRALTYFEDAEEDPMPHMLTRVTWDEVTHEVRAIVEKFGTK